MAVTADGKAKRTIGKMATDLVNAQKLRKSLRRPSGFKFAIADAMQLGCSRLSLGRTALEPKARLGAQAQAITVWMRHRQPVMNVFVRNLLCVIPHEEAPERNPFKK